MTGDDSTPLDAPSRDAIVDAVRADLFRRSQVGLLKYGVPLTRPDVDLRGWLEHAYHEALDMALYLKCAMRRIDEGKGQPR